MSLNVVLVESAIEIVLRTPHSAIIIPQFVTLQINDFGCVNICTYTLRTSNYAKQHCGPEFLSEVRYALGKKIQNNTFFTSRTRLWRVRIIWTYVLFSII